MNRAADWLKQAEWDLQAAEDSAGKGHHEWAAFQAQQCAEKAVKALVQFLHGSVRGHGIAEILRQLPATLTVPQAIREAAVELDHAYIPPRYPTAFATGSPHDYYTESNSRKLIEYARQTLEFCRSQIH